MSPLPEMLDWSAVRSPTSRSVPATQGDALQRRQLGAWYTPPELVDVLVDDALRHWPRTGRATPLRVLDPACGDGRFLTAVATRLGGRLQVTGIDLDPVALDNARARLGTNAELICADALHHEWGGRTFDLVIGNPPFLSQLSSLTSRGGRSRLGGGPYADAAVEFLALAQRLAAPGGGRVALVLPVSLLAARDAGPVRAAVMTESTIVSCWWSERSVFPDADVRTCALVLERTAAVEGTGRSVSRSVGLPPVPVPSLRHDTNPDSASWGWLLADQLGVPRLDPVTLCTSGVLGDRAAVRADFRNQYYGLVGAVDDDGDGPPLITSGLIDPGHCHWGHRPARFGGVRHAAPRVHLDRLDGSMATWAAQRLVPKVLVASQTRVIEAVADPDGSWLPSVPVVSVLPPEPSLVWDCAAVLTSPVASAWLAHRSAGTGLSPRALRVSAPEVAAVPWPAGDLRPAVNALRGGDIIGCAERVNDAYAHGFGEQRDGGSFAELMAWWCSALPGGDR